MPLARGGTGTERCSFRPAFFAEGNWPVERRPGTTLLFGSSANRVNVPRVEFACKALHGWPVAAGGGDVVVVRLHVLEPCDADLIAEPLHEGAVLVGEPSLRLTGRNINRWRRFGC